jgi:peptide/nickel transport system permease protein
MLDGLIKIWRHLLGQRQTRFAIYIIAAWFVIALFHPFIANDQALLAKNKKGISSPVLSKILNPNSMDLSEYTWKLMPLIPYSSGTIDLKNSYKGPLANQNVSSFHTRHWLGTDKLGRDTFAGLIHGSYFALIIGIGASFISVIIGVCIGLLAGYWKNDKLKLNLIQIFLALLMGIAFMYSLSIGFFFGFEFDFIYELVFLLLFITVFTFLIYKSSGLNLISYSIPVDSIVMRILEVFKSVPVLFFVLSFLAVFSNATSYSIIVIIAIVTWPISCRYTRAEVLAINEEDYIKSARVLGLPNFNIVSKHILPNVISPALIVFAFGVSSAVVLEATLSFLGLGLSVDQVTWGSMLSEVRSNFKAWWLVLFPGILLFIVVSSMNTLSDGVNNYLRK